MGARTQTDLLEGGLGPHEAAGDLQVEQPQAGHVEHPQPSLRGDAQRRPLIVLLRRRVPESAAHAGVARHLHHLSAAAHRLVSLLCVLALQTELPIQRLLPGKRKLTLVARRLVDAQFYCSCAQLPLLLPEQRASLLSCLISGSCSAAVRRPSADLE